MVAHLKELSATIARAPEALVEDPMAGYLEELAQLRDTLDARYHGIKGGHVKPDDVDEAFHRIRTKSEDRRRA